MRIFASVGLVVIFAGLFSSAAHAQWTVTYLHPAGAVDSFAPARPASIREGSRSSAATITPALDRLGRELR